MGKSNASQYANFGSLPLGSPWVLYMNHSFSKSLSLHIILVLKLCCEDSPIGGFCQDAIFGYLRDMITKFIFLFYVQNMIFFDE